ncbi:uncharacterized protein LOC122262060 [Penaeus japonicus]|uniref:uncharacterized protein LOC122262060 n=1 Tax=Penaeus japonicus TaxID=27405 RepID=UPI001C70D5E4|nr:uncharacterized protein LOC122262060 [Penaeus japonicus]
MLSTTTKEKQQEWEKAKISAFVLIYLSTTIEFGGCYIKPSTFVKNLRVIHRYMAFETKSLQKQESLSKIERTFELYQVFEPQAKHVSSLLTCHHGTLAVTTPALNLASDGGNRDSMVPPGYRQELAPIPLDGVPLRVNFSIKVNGIFESDERQTTVILDTFFRVTWVDWRLNFPTKNESQRSKEEGEEEEEKQQEEGEGKGEEEEEVITINIHPVILERLWLPDPYFFSVRSVKTVNILKQVQGVLFSSDNSLYISTVMKIELDCSRAYARYPFDKQECWLDVYSFTLLEVSNCSQELLNASGEGSIKFGLISIHFYWCERDLGAGKVALKSPTITTNYINVIVGHFSRRSGNRFPNVLVCDCWSFGVITVFNWPEQPACGLISARHGLMPLGMRCIAPTHLVPRITASHVPPTLTFVAPACRRRRRNPQCSWASIMLNSLMNTKPKNDYVDPWRFGLGCCWFVELDSTVFRVQKIFNYIFFLQPLYMYSLDEVRLGWLPSGLVVDPRVASQLNNYEYEFKPIVGNGSCACYMCIPPNSPCVQAQLILTRKVLGHLLGTFLPSGLFVAVSWASLFWPADVIPGRTVLVITSLLTLTSMHTAVRQISPETSYVKAVDVWMFMCIVVSLLTLFEYGVVLVIRKTTQSKVVPSTTTVQQVSQVMGVKLTPRMKPPPHLSHEEHLEKATRIALPCVFLLFNVVYWPYYLA